jgi:hypothetical protein
MASPVLQFKRGAFADLPALSAGEPGFTTDRYDLYIGTGAGTTESNIFVGSQRFWSVGTASTGSGVKFVEGTGNGTNDILIKAPDTLTSSYTLVLPPNDGVADSVLTSDGSGNLSWGSGSANAVFTGITTFNDTTDNTLGDANTGAVQIDGGLGVNKNVTIGAGLSVTGNSYFVGMVTFAGGTDGNISIGDSTADNIIINGRIDSHLIPDDDGTYDLGSSSLEWRDLYIDGTANIDTLAAGTAAITDLTENRVVIAGTSGELEDDGNLTYDGTDLSTNSLIVTDLTDNRVLIAGSGGAVEDDGNLTYDGTDLSTNSLIVTDLTQNDVLIAGSGGAVNDSGGNLTFSSNTLTVTNTIDVTNIEVTNVKAKDGTTAITIADSSGDVSIASTLTVSGDLVVTGAQTIVNTETLKVEDSLVEVGLVNSGGDLVAPSSDADIDVGLIFHYYSAGSAKKAAVYWDDSVSRIVVASNVSESNSILSATANSGYGELEIRALHINDCAGASQVISCTGSERFLENITIDGGTFV